MQRGGGRGLMEATSPVSPVSEHPDERTVDPERSPDAAPRRRRVRTAIVVATITLVAAGSVFAVQALRPAPEPAAAPAPPAAEATVTAGNLTAETSVRGKLRYAENHTLAAARGGTITELPAPETTLYPGSTAYRIDTIPTVVMAGTMPAWRDFAQGMTPGPDVRQLEENLRSFGYLDAEPSEDFTWHTRWAIRSWQRDLGLPAEDTLSKDLVLFAAAPLHVSTLDRQLGDRVDAGTTLFRATGTVKEISASVKPEDAELAAVGAAVTVDLPGGTSAPGTVTGVAAAEEAPNPANAAAGAEASTDATGAAPGELRIPVVITLDDAAATAGLALVSVTVRLGSVVREDVLTVPVDALVPVDAERFAVELAGNRTGGANTPRLIPVTVGAFASGLVEISGDGIREGLTVTVPQR